MLPLGGIHSSSIAMNYGNKKEANALVQMKHAKAEKKSQLNNKKKRQTITI